MAANYCTRCGSNITQDDKFCGNCGQLVSTATMQKVRDAPRTPPPASTARPTSTPQYPQLTPSSRLGAAFWLGLIGGVFGIFIGAMFITLALAMPQSLEYWLRYIGIIAFSIIGIVGALKIIERGDTINALLMILAGVGVLVSAYIFGIFSALLFFVGAALLYMKKG